MYKLSPSKAHRYLNCTKSLEFDVAFVETPATIRGNILHSVAELALKNEDISEQIKIHEIDGYEQSLIQSYVNAVWQEYERVFGNRLRVEQKRTINLYGNTINLVIDALIVGKDEASIIDLKTGRGDVDVFDNEQLYFYAYYVFTNYAVFSCRVSIFQKNKLKTIVLKRYEVFDYFIAKDETFKKIAQNELEYNPSEKACKFCANKDSCVARAKWIITGDL